MRSAIVHFALQPLLSLRNAPEAGQQVDADATERPLLVRCENIDVDASQRRIVAPTALPATGATMTRWTRRVWDVGSGTENDAD